MALRLIPADTTVHGSLFLHPKTIGDFRHLVKMQGDDVEWKIGSGAGSYYLATGQVGSIDIRVFAPDGHSLEQLKEVLA